MILHFQPSAPGTGVARIGATEDRKKAVSKEKASSVCRAAIPHITEHFVERRETQHAAQLIEELRDEVPL